MPEALSCDLRCHAIGEHESCTSVPEPVSRRTGFAELLPRKDRPRLHAAAGGPYHPQYLSRLFGRCSGEQRAQQAKERLAALVGTCPFAINDHGQVAGFYGYQNFIWAVEMTP